MSVRGNFALIDEDVLVAAFANSPRYGGGLRLAPEARLDDGRIDVVVVRRMSVLAVLRALPSAYRGRHLANPNVRFERDDAVALECRPGTAVYADGELIGETGSSPTVFRCVAGALSVAVGQKVRL